MDNHSKCHYPTLQSHTDVFHGKFHHLDDVIELDIRNGFPGAVLIVIKDGVIIKHTAYGYSKKFEQHTLLQQPLEMRRDTIFDIASNTKMYATNFALQKLFSEGKLNLYARVQEYIPAFSDSSSDLIKGKSKICIRDLLQHCAGFLVDTQYYSPAKAKELYSQDRSTTLQMVTKTRLQCEPGTKNVYRDVNYILLGYIVEILTKQHLDEYVEQHIYKPLQLMHTMFNPLQKGCKPEDFAATELIGNTRDRSIHFPNIRTMTLQGEVHDEKTYYSMGGVSGHAGLFSTAKDIAVLLQVMLNKGGYDSVKLFDSNTTDIFTEPSPLNPTFGLGWRRNSDSSMEWMFGPHASSSAIGHTGWTGTITLIDFKHNLGIALLTNKKHSKVIDPKKNSNIFFGDTFQTGKYGTVMKHVYEALRIRTKK